MLARKSELAVMRAGGMSVWQILRPGVVVGLGLGMLSAQRITLELAAEATGERWTLAGLTFEFLYAPDSEAPEEMPVLPVSAMTCPRATRSPGCTRTLLRCA